MTDELMISPAIMTSSIAIVVVDLFRMTLRMSGLSENKNSYSCHPLPGI